MSRIIQSNNIKATQLYRLTDGEWLDEIEEDLKNLQALGIRISVLLVNRIKAVKRSFRDTII